jgi:hypothetical protein
VNLTIEIKLDPKVIALIERLIETLRDLMTVAEPFTGFRIIPEDKED